MPRYKSIVRFTSARVVGEPKSEVMEPENSGEKRKLLSIAPRSIPPVRNDCQNASPPASAWRPKKVRYRSLRYCVSVVLRPTYSGLLKNDTDIAKKASRTSAPRPFMRVA